VGGERDTFRNTALAKLKGADRRHHRKDHANSKNQRRGDCGGVWGVPELKSESHRRSQCHGRHRAKENDGNQFRLKSRRARGKGIHRRGAKTGGQNRREHQRGKKGARKIEGEILTQEEAETLPYFYIATDPTHTKEDPKKSKHKNSRGKSKTRGEKSFY